MINISGGTVKWLLFGIASFLCHRNEAAPRRQRYCIKGEATPKVVRRMWTRKSRRGSLRTPHRRDAAGNCGRANKDKSGGKCGPRSSSGPKRSPRTANRAVGAPRESDVTTSDSRTGGRRFVTHPPLQLSERVAQWRRSRANFRAFVRAAAYFCMAGQGHPASRPATDRTTHVSSVVAERQVSSRLLTRSIPTQSSVVLLALAVRIQCTGNGE